MTRALHVKHSLCAQMCLHWIHYHRTLRKNLLTFNSVLYSSSDAQISACLKSQRRPAPWLSLPREAPPASPPGAPPIAADRNVKPHPKPWIWLVYLSQTKQKHIPRFLFVSLCLNHTLHHMTQCPRFIFTSKYWWTVCFCKI